MLLRLEPNSDIPIYLQIRRQIVAGFARGELAAGEQLPSVRQMAVDIGVNLHTVNKAYALLQDEGYLSMNGRRGAVVTQPPPMDAEFLERLRAQLCELLMEAKARGGSAEAVDRIWLEARVEIDGLDKPAAKKAGQSGRENKTEENRK